MTLQEFKNWFDGVAFAISDRPTKEQWQQIKDKLSAVRSESILKTNLENSNA